MQIVSQIISLIIFIYLGAFALYYLLFAAAALFYRETFRWEGKKTGRFIVLIPAYKEDRVIIDTAKSAATHKSDNCRFDVAVIADSLAQETITALKKLPVKIIEVGFEKSTKAKALNKAIDILGDSYDYALVLDADNVMAAGCLDEIYTRLQSGFEIVQGHRQDKNRDTSFAILDAVSEGVNNSIFRRGHRCFGLSAALIGSGFAAEYGLFVKVMREIRAVGGFDKEMEIRLIKNGYRIGFANKAVIYDEKVQQAEVFAQQRRRWLSAQFIYFARYFGTACKELMRKGNIDLFDKVMQMVSPPRVLQLGLSAIFAFTFCLWQWVSRGSTWFSPSCIYWASLFAVSFTAILIATPRKYYTLDAIKAVLSLPKAFIMMFLTLFRLKGANKKFIHTRHGH